MGGSNFSKLSSKHGRGRKRDTTVTSPCDEASPLNTQVRHNTVSLVGNQVGNMQLTTVYSSGPSDETGSSNTQDTMSFTGNTITGDVHLYTTYRASSKTRRVEFGLPLISDKVTGRDKEVTEMYELLTADRRVVITGMGGVGKTTLAHHCARHWLQQSPTHNIAILNAETTHTFHQDLNHLAAELCIPTHDRKHLEIIKDIFNYFLNSNIPAIYDNINTYEVVENFMPNECMQHVYILGTSQISELSASFTVYPLECLDMEAGMDVMRQILLMDQFCEDEVRELVQKLGGLPLAIVQAAAFLVDSLQLHGTQHNLKDYLTQYTKYLDARFPDDFRSFNKRTVHATLHINIDKVNQETSKHILACMAYLEPNSISIDLFFKHFKTECVKIAVRELAKYSLVKIYPENVLHIHRLVQEILRESYDASIYIPLVISILVKTEGNLWSHYRYLIQQADPQSILELIEVGFRQVFQSGELLEKLKQDLQSVHLVQSVTHDWGVWQFAAYKSAEIFLLLNARFPYIHSHTSEWTPWLAGSLNWNCLQYIEARLDKTLVNHQTEQGLTALHIASARGPYFSVETLIRRACDVNVCDKAGNTALHWACSKLACEDTESYERIINELIRSGVITDAKNNIGKTAVELCGEVPCVISSDDGPIDGVRKYMITPKTSSIEKQLLHIEIFIGSQGETYMLNKLRESVRWDRTEEGLIKELVRMLCNSYQAIRIISGYIITEGISVGEAMKRLKQPHPVVDILMENCGTASHQYRHVFHSVCLVLDTIKHRHNQAFNLLAYWIYREYFNTRFNPYLENIASVIKLNKTDLENCMEFIKKYISVEMSVLTKVIIHIYTEYSDMDIKIKHNVLRLSFDYSWSTCTSVLGAMNVEDIRRFYINEGVQGDVCRYEGTGCKVTELHNWSALHYACIDDRNKSLRVVERLVELKVDVNLQVGGIAPIHLAACSTGYAKVVTLLRAGADVSIMTYEGWTAFDFAIFTRNTDAVWRLLTQGVDAAVVNMGGHTNIPAQR